MEAKKHDPTEYISLSEAARLVPGHPHASSLWRWARKGVKARNGETIRLEHRRIGARVFVRRADLDNFFSEVARADAEHFNQATIPPQEPKTRTEKQRVRDIERAKGNLQAAGWM